MQLQRGIVPSSRFVDVSITFKTYYNVNNPESTPIPLDLINNENSEHIIIFVQSGKIIYYTDKEKIVLGKNDVILFRPFEKINIKTMPNQDSEFYIASFLPQIFSHDEETLLRAYYYSDSNNIYRLDSIKNGNQIADSFIKIRDYCYLNLKIGHFIALLKIILSEICIAFDKIQPESASKYSQEYDSKIYSYICQNFSKNLLIKTVAEKFYVSVSYINKVCKKFYSMPYRQMLIDIRMWYARKLMKESYKEKQRTTIKRISEVCGYSDYSAFYKAYLSYFGISPKDDSKYFLEHGSFYVKSDDENKGREENSRKGIEREQKRE